MYIKDPNQFLHRRVKFRRSIETEELRGEYVTVQSIRKNEGSQFGDVRDYTALGEVTINGKVHKVTFNLGWVTSPKF
jgi:hypothetical protein